MLMGHKPMGYMTHTQKIKELSNCIYTLCNNI